MTLWLPLWSLWGALIPVYDASKPFWGPLHELLRLIPLCGIEIRRENYVIWGYQYDNVVTAVYRCFKNENRALQGFHIGKKMDIFARRCEQTCQKMRKVVRNGGFRQGDP